MVRTYKGVIEWHTGEPPRKGYYLVSQNGYVAEWKFYKERSKSYWENYVENEDGGYQKFDSVQAWAFLPIPYAN